MAVEISDWRGMYKENWKGDIYPEAFAHPAKYSKALIRAIYDHLIEKNWIKPGDTVVDPFGGVALGGLFAAVKGLDWIGVELEPRFVKLGNQNIEIWRKKYGLLPGYGSVRLLEGDSRELTKVLSEASAAISSPPFGEAGTRDRTKTSPGDVADCMKRAYTQKNQGETAGNLAALRSTQKGLEMAISSPPYADSLGNEQSGIDWSKQADRKSAHPHGYNGGGYSGVVSSPPYAEARIGQVSGQEHCGRGDQYGAASGQLGAMKAEGYEAAISSPPFEDTLSRDVVDAEARRSFARANGISNAEHISPIDMEQIGARDQTYGDTPGNPGNDTGEDFWLAARRIVEQVYMVLNPGAHAVWVVKAYVKNKELVDFPGQWRQLCEAVGFVTLHEHRAWLVEDRGSQHDLTGRFVEKKAERKSFFRRLAERKGSPKIDWETVYCMVKPE